MTSKEFVEKLKKVATDYKTLYVNGCLGAPMNASNKKFYCTWTSYNAKPERTKKIMNASTDTFGFDCVCVIKSILYGWNGDRNARYGGGKYGSNGVPDIGTEEMIKVCSDVSTDFSNIEVGELLWIKGHVGVYIGDGLAVECTSKWKDGVQITACNCDKAGYNRRNWTKHGKLPYVEYEKEPVATTDKMTSIKVPVLKKGSKGEAVKTLQRLLNDILSMKLTVDGSFGPATETALKKFQQSVKIGVDGSCGPATWEKLING